MILLTTITMVTVVFQRKYYLTVIDKFLSDAFDSLDSIEGILMSVFVCLVYNCRQLKID